jgi:superfamily II DNA/RNA helicase
MVGGKSKKERSSDLALGEQINTPSQLSQYFMMVTCKWRLAALLCFLKMHAHEKVMVFFATCDSVDYHALLMNNAKVRMCTRTVTTVYELLPDMCLIFLFNSCRGE